MNWPPKIGTAVNINEEGLRRYWKGRTNPANVKGYVIENEPDDSEGWVRVSWENGETNTYQEGTLSVYRPKQMENK